MFLTFLLGCPSPPTTATTPAPVDEPEPCAVTALVLAPTDGAEGVYHRDPLVWALFGADPTATAEVVGPNGPVAGQLVEAPPGELVFLTDALERSTTYTATLALCTGSRAVVSTFTTSDLGAPLDDPGSPVGRTFVGDLESAEWVEPAQAWGPLLDQQGSTAGLAVTVVSRTSIRLGAVNPEVPTEQDLCSPTTEAAGLDLAASPALDVPVDRLPLPLVPDVLFQLEEATFGAVFTSSGDTLERGRVQGQLDLRDLGDDVCSLVETFGIDCVPCADGEIDCMRYDLRQIPFTDLGGPALVARTAVDIANDPSCSP
ncbi:MAG: hypothetical protein R3F61_00280 [Myxococcota bacterium]